MFPRPVLDFLPRIYLENPEAATIALANLVDAYLNETERELLEFCNIHNLARTPSLVLEEIGYQLNADLQPGDSDRLRRQKTSTAVQGHRRRGTWDQDAKPKIDAIVGGDSQLVNIDIATDDDDIMLAGLSSDPTTFWGVFGTDGVNLDSGVAQVGSGRENNIDGVVWIDIDNSTITQDIVDDIEFALRDVVPAYFVIVYGITIGGVFTPFPLPTISGPLLTEDGRQILTEDGLNVLVAEGSRA